MDSHPWVGLCMQRLVELDTDHLYRHLTEVNGKDTRGGYIDGKLEFAASVLESPFGLKISLVSDVNPKTAYSGRLHPNLLYMTRFEGTKRKRDLEAATPLWRIDLEIKDGEVFWWTESDAQPLFAQRLDVQLQPNPRTGVRNILDLKDLHLTVITPLVRTNVNGIRVSDSLGMRKPLFEDLEDHEWEEILRKLTKFYTNKENKSEMDKICLQFALHRMIPEEDNKEELEPMCPVLYSSPICNSKSRALGILELIPDMVSAQKACCRNSRTVFLLSKFALPGGLNPEREAFPRFVIKRPEEEFSVDPRLRQPEDVSIVAGRVIVFRTPKQCEEAVGDIYREGGKIYVDVFRPKDKQSSNVKIEFEFKMHTMLLGDDFEWCSMCVEDPDRIGGRTMKEYLKQRLTETGTARPGVKRRRRDNVTGVAGSHPQVDSPAPENLFEEISGADFNIVAEQFNNEDFDLEDFLNPNPAMPDVLMGVMGRGGSMECVPGTPQTSQFVPASHNIGDNLEFVPASPRSMECIQGSPRSMECIPGSPRSLECVPGSLHSLESVGSVEMFIQESHNYLESFGTACMAESASIASSDLVDISPVQGSDDLESLDEMHSFQHQVRCDENTVDGRLSSSSSSPPLERVKIRHERYLTSPTRCYPALPQQKKEEKEEKEEEDKKEKVQRQEENPVSSINLISRINNIGKLELETAESQGDSYNDYETSDQSDIDIKPKVMEMTKMFGGARFGGAKKKIEELRSNLPRVRSKTRGLEEKEARCVPGGGTEGMECLPAIIFLLTPGLVVILAWLLHTWWTSQDNSLHTGAEVEE